MDLTALNDVARAMVADGKGILAADDSSGTIKKRFDAIGIEFDERTGRDYRMMMFGSQDAISKCISGVILHDEMIRPQHAETEMITVTIARMGAVPGVKVDEGTQPLAGCLGEFVTVGLDKLAGRLPFYYQAGVRFAKWRAAIEIGNDIPTNTAIRANAHALGRYAAICQAAGVVPVIEPEVTMNGNHGIDRCYDVSREVLDATFRELHHNCVALEGTILKPNMVLPGSECQHRCSVDEVAEKTVRLMKTCVPAAVPGIAFLSGGQSDEDATAHLNAMNRGASLPWRLTFSYGRALHLAPLMAWSGKIENILAGRKAFSHRALMNSLATKGRWTPDMERIQHNTA
jgi:fructose-bisphosphate aldolase class I